MQSLDQSEYPNTTLLHTERLINNSCKKSATPTSRVVQQLKRPAFSPAMMSHICHNRASFSLFLWTKKGSKGELLVSAAAFLLLCFVVFALQLRSRAVFPPVVTTRFFDSRLCFCPRPDKSLLLKLYEPTLGCNRDAQDLFSSKKLRSPVDESIQVATQCRVRDKFF